MNDQHLKLSLESGRSSDAYYLAATHWITNKQTKELGDKCQTLAVIYKDALDDLLIYLRELPPSTSVKAEIDRTVEYQLLLATDIKFGFNAVSK